MQSVCRAACGAVCLCVQFCVRGSLFTSCDQRQVYIDPRDEKYPNHLSSLPWWCSLKKQTTVENHVLMGFGTFEISLI